MKRRDFLLNSLGASALLLVKSTVDSTLFNQNFHSETKFIIGNGKEVFKVKGYYSTSTASECSLNIANKNGGFFSIEAPCKAHEVTIHPKNKNLVLSSAKWGKEAYIADLHSQKLVKTVSMNSNTEFYGHNVFSKDGQFVFMTMMDFDKDAGFISVRETKNLNEVRRIPTYGRIPHQLRWLETDKLVGVINSISLNDEDIGSSLLNIVNVHTGELVKTYRMKGYGNTHFSFFENHDHAFVGRNINQYDYSFYQMLDLENAHLLAPEKILTREINTGEALSHVILEDRNLVIATLTGVNEVVAWDYKNNEIVATFQVQDSPRGIALSKDQKTLAITFVNNDKNIKTINLYDFDKSFLKKPLSPKVTLKGGNGSHLTLV